MLTVKNDLTDSSYTRSDLYVHCIYSDTSAFNEEHQCHHGLTHIWHNFFVDNFKETNKFTLGKESLVHLMYHDLSEL